MEVSGSKVEQTVQFASDLANYQLEDEDYYEIDASDLFPFLTPDVVLEFLEEGEAEGQLPW